MKPGEHLGPYEILAPIGKGGMGEVWKARDTRLDRTVAIKISAEQFSERFEREARAVAALNHPNICQLYDVGPNYLVMEYVEGSPLKGPMSAEKAVEFGVQILDALDAAHKKDITHRDLKPANILVTKHGIKLLDFGLAKQGASVKESDSTLTQGLTGEGQILGTLQYMSPEQLQGKKVDARSDLFGFGCVLYEMLSGKRAFEGQSSASVIAAILEREPAPLDTALPLGRIVKRSLAKDPDQRFQTARDLKAALTWTLEQAPGVSQSKPNRRWWIVTAAAVFLTALGGWTVGHFRQRPTDDRVLQLQLNPPEGARFVFSPASGIALSPDGKTAAYVASANGKAALWVQPLDGTAARPLPGTESAGGPFWSPDSRAIAFFSESGGRLERVDLAGGAPLTICDVPQQSRGGVWGTDGQIMFGTQASGLFRVPATGGTSVPVTMLDASRTETAHRSPQLLPGDRILYWIQAGKPENTGAYAASLAKPNERTHLLTTDNNALYARGANGKSYLLWLRRGTATLLAQELDVSSLKLRGEPHPIARPVASVRVIGQTDASVSATGLLLYSASNTLSQFTWLDRKGKPLGVVGEPAEWGPFDFSPDGRTIAATRGQADGYDLWMLETERGVSSRFTFRPGISNFPVWSPDNRAIVFSSDASDASRNLFRKEVTGAGIEQRVTQSPNVQLVTDWSRDGRFLLYWEIAPGTGFDLWILPVMPDGRPVPDAKPKPYLRTPFNEWNGRFSPEPNPRWVAYQSDESGRYEVYINSFPAAGGKIRISTEGGAYPEWGGAVGKDGRELFYVSPDNKLMTVNLKFVRDSVEASVPHELFDLPAAEPQSSGWSPYQVTPDGNRFLVRATPQQASPPLTVIVNWPALLKKGQAAP